MNTTILDRDAEWLAHASEDELREFVRAMDELDPTSEQYKELKKMLDAECRRRSGEYYERLDGGEWI